MLNDVHGFSQGYLKDMPFNPTVTHYTWQCTLNKTENAQEADRDLGDIRGEAIDTFGGTSVRRLELSMPTVFLVSTASCTLQPAFRQSP
jgi:hypothetical protein